MTDKEILSFLESHKSILKIAGILKNILREIGYEILKALANLWDILAGSQAKTLDLLDFTSYPKLAKFVQDYQVLGIAIAGICVVGLGFFLMRDKESDLQKIMTNIFVATILFIATPLFITNLNQITKGAATSILDDTNPAGEVFSQNVTDLFKVNEAKWTDDWYEQTTIINAPGQENETQFKSNYPNYFGEGDESYKNMNITEVMPVGDWNVYKESDTYELTKKAEKALQYKIGYIKGTAVLYKLEDKFLNVKEAYYRYTWNPWVIFFTITAGLIISVFLIWRLVHLEMELGFSGIWAQLTSFTDLHSGKRNIQLIQTIVNCSVVIVAIFLLQKINILAWLYIDTLDWDTPLKVLVKLAVAAFIVNGPNVIEQMFGIDSGTRGFMQSVTGAAMGLNSMMGLGRSAKNSAKSLGKAGGKMAGAVANGTQRGASAIGEAASNAGKSIFSKGKEASTNAMTKSMNKNRNKKAENYGNENKNNTHQKEQSTDPSRLSKHTRSDTKGSSSLSPKSIFNRKNAGNGASTPKTNTAGKTGVAGGNRTARNMLANRTHTAAINRNRQTASSARPQTNAGKYLPTGGNVPGSIFPKANFNSRSMRRDQQRLSDALQSKRPHNQSRAQIKEFARQNKELLRSGRG
ncbi:hypothetical protein A5819_003749 [Enterococcus sp. 7E2_DIV0204]|uniref:pLS20_p028 family conjugation system transmembrane protein n=1 Tax=unclassified Enterococcus TaxID=2608891 RepID=UPI000A34E586|nr:MULTISPECIES: hypothetical protein [unclassified Enterococcus]OTN83769.1 hypothetical protein A5819_003749 [Enterococcus sp. 7E2_DIV0204]OTP47140.1 hypothetical protein A5884_003677 [Enterococcus sp. 7D2_DIV0200]